MNRRAKLSEAEIASRLAGLPGWTVTDGKLQKTFRCQRFPDGIAFVNRVAAVAEEMDHHPDIFIRFGLVTITLMTHSAQGLTELDFEQASRLDELARSGGMQS